MQHFWEHARMQTARVVRTCCPASGRFDTKPGRPTAGTHLPGVGDQTPGEARPGAVAQDRLAWRCLS